MPRPARATVRPDGSLVLRARFSSTMWGPLIALAPVSFAFVDNVFTDRRRPDPFLASLVGLLVVELLLCLVAARRRRVVLHHDRLELHHAFRSETLLLADVQAVTVGGAPARPEIWTADRRRHTSLVLNEADLAVVGDWWLERRGSGWRPAWEPAPPTALNPW